jgi:flagellar basal-body rod modification protein FlgD
MSTVTGTTSSTSTAGGTTSTASRNSLGKDDFLKLLTAQLQNQDPLNPQDNSAFVAQLAQFSSLEQLQNVSGKLDTMLTAEATTNQLSTTNLVGKAVLYKTDRVSLTQGQPTELQLSLDGNAASTMIVISNANGDVVRRLDAGARGAGTSTVTWDGRDASGNTLPTGDYLVSVSATGADGGKVSSAARTRGTITGVTFDAGVAKLLVGSATIPMSDVISISAPTA